MVDETPHIHKILYMYILQKLCTQFYGYVNHIERKVGGAEPPSSKAKRVNCPENKRKRIL